MAADVERARRARRAEKTEKTERLIGMPSKTSKTRKTRKTRKTVKIYYPKKYYKGLSQKRKTERKKEIRKYGALSWKNPKAYVGFKTDKNVRTKTSKYTKSWKDMFPDAKSLEDKSKVTGVPLKYIKESYNRGMAAWRTGHRPGATEQQWGYARTSSLLLCGKTYHTTDSDLVRKAKKESAAARKWWNGC